MAYKFFDATIIDVIEVSDNIRRFFVRMPEESGFKFRAGQFIMFNLPISSKYTNRSYSIASAPNADRAFEVCIVRKEGGVGTAYEWEHFIPGATVKVSNALGKFTLEEPIDNDLCFIATGTGIAPLRSMILDIYNRHVPHRNIFLVFGNRWERDILYRDEFESLQKEHPEFHFIPVLSRNNPGWTGQQGYVHHVYEELFADRRPATFYLCGWRDMLKEARSRLSAIGYGDSLRYESFD